MEGVEGVIVVKTRPQVRLGEWAVWGMKEAKELRHQHLKGPSPWRPESPGAQAEVAWERVTASPELKSPRTEWACPGGGVVGDTVSPQDTHTWRF